MRWYVGVVFFVGCSSPARPVMEAPPTSPLAFVLDAGLDADEELLPNYRYEFHWQTLRDDYEAFRKSPIDNADPCDIRRRTYTQRLACPGPHEMAGLVTRAGAGRKPGTVRVLIDRGARDLISTDWTVALLDDEGHPLTEWVSVAEVRDDEAYAEFETTQAIATRNHRAGMRVDQLLRDAKLRKQGRQ
ncbi:MAG: hypothetical protein ABI867_01495 [Kofleriaceae bacterium]